MSIKRHFLSEVDHEARRGICAVCGPVSLNATSSRGKEYLHCSIAQQERFRNYAKSNPDAIEDSRLRKKYGITLAEYRQMVQEQDGKCARCSKRVDDLKIRLAVDHCHKTGVVRKLLCTTCNTYLGKLEANRDQIERDLHYLDTGSFEQMPIDN